MSHDDMELGTVQFTQHMLIRKLWEDFGTVEWPASQLPAVTGQVLIKGDGDRTMNDTITKMYQSATVSCMYIM
jgi:hypothetical protein